MQRVLSMAAVAAALVAWALAGAGCAADAGGGANVTTTAAPAAAAPAAAPILTPTSAPASRPGGRAMVSATGDAFMGEYEGTYGPADGQGVAAKARVIAEGDDQYRAILVIGSSSTGDRPGPDRMEVTGKLSNGAVSLRSPAEGEKLWQGGIADSRLTLVNEGATGVGFHLKQVVRHSPTEGAKPPSGAVVLMPYEPGKPSSLSEWRGQNWRLLPDGSVLAAGGDNRTVREFGDIRLHVEFMTPLMPKARGQGRGNSGVYLQDRYEVQVLDSFGLTPTQGDCGGIYSTAAPKVNACLPPLAWQTYDITFRAPRPGADGKATRPAMITVVHNGVTIHENQPIPKSTGGGAAGEAAAGPIKLQYHNNPVQFRNIWLVELSDEAAK